MEILFDPNTANRARCLPGRCLRVKHRLGELRVFGLDGMVKKLEAGVGIEPTHTEFCRCRSNFQRVTSKYSRTVTLTLNSYAKCVNITVR
jgi:hypothetical protein